MTDHTHGEHAHTHGPECEHVGVQHEQHTDYLHDGHLHHQTDGDVEEHAIPESSTNPDVCRAAQRCPCDEQHDVECEHPRVPHAGHTDFLVDGRLHHPHGEHCDDHGPVQLVHNK